MEIRTEFTADKTVKSKTVGLGIGASFRFEILFGLITIKGSASYARSETKTDTEVMVGNESLSVHFVQVHVQMNYFTSKYARTISKKTPIDFPAVCNSSNQYTHVVTSATYGLQAVLDFHRKTRAEDFEGNLAGSMGWILGMIPGLATGSRHMSDEDRVVADSCTLTVFGDFAPEEPMPGNLVQAVEFYRNLPLLTGSEENHWEGSSIQEFHATPITELCKDLNPTMKEISESLMMAMEDMMGELEQLSMKAGGLLDSEAAIRFEPIQANLDIYKKALDVYTISLKKTISEIVPRIRAEDELAEDELIQLLLDHANSQFQIDKSLEFLVNRGREIQAVTFLLESFPTASNRLVQDFRSANDAGILMTRKAVVLMELNVLSSVDVSNSFLEGTPMDESNFWYNNQTVSGQVGGTLRSFFDFTAANADLPDRGYLIKLNLVSEGDPTTLTAFVDGVALPNHFEVPLTSNFIEPFDVTVNGFKFVIPKANNFVTSVKYFIEDITTLSTTTEERQFGSDDLTVTVDDVLPLHQFVLAYSLTTALGSTPSNLASATILTSPATEPQGLGLVSASCHSLTVSWRPPAIVAEALKSQLLYRAQLWQGNHSTIRLTFLFYQEILY